MLAFLRSEVFYIVLRAVVVVTLFLFIVIMERSFVRAGVRGRGGRMFEVIAAFLLGIAMRGLIYLLIG
ncbi:MAG: hypothetical protein AMS17_16265 [Spirochaetes bacterium DG_61]|jgi:hypothetical protein|nr:MAG: hypothetical protein AMS17_16265 [Spirochaetes bacterium DG_61]